MAKLAAENCFEKKKHDDDSIGDDTGNINDINKTYAPDFTTAT